MQYRNGSNQSECIRERKVAILSPHFPPATLAGVHRARHLAKHLGSFGWHPIIVRAHETHFTERLDPELAQLVPSEIEQLRTGAIPAWLTRPGYRGYRIESFFSLPKRALGSCPGTKVRCGLDYWVALLSDAAQQLCEANPWNPGHLGFSGSVGCSRRGNRPFFSKGRMAHRLSVWLEPYAVQNADYITSVSSKQNSELASRYPGFDSTQMAAIPIGGDPDDFAALRLNPPLNPTVRLDPNKKKLCLCRYVSSAGRARRARTFCRPSSICG